MGNRAANPLVDYLTSVVPSDVPGLLGRRLQEVAMPPAATDQPLPTARTTPNADVGQQGALDTLGRWMSGEFGHHRRANTRSLKLTHPPDGRTVVQGTFAESGSHR
jgi:hypothetical protein